MVLIAVKIQADDPAGVGFFERVHNKLISPSDPINNQNPVINPFNDPWLDQPRPGLYCLHLGITWPPFPLYGFILCLLGILFNWPFWVFVISGVIMSIYVLWKPPFYKFMLRLGLRNHGYKGEILFLSSEDYIKECRKFGADRSF